MNSPRLTFFLALLFLVPAVNAQVRPSPRPGVLPGANAAGAPATNAPRPRPAFPAFPSPRPQTAATNTVVPAAPAQGAPAQGAPGTPTAGAPANAAPTTPSTSPDGGPNPATGSVVPGLNPNEIIPQAIMKLQDQPLDQVLDVYSDLTGRTVLRPSNLPTTKITLKTQSPLTRKESVLALDSVLSLNGITMVPQGEKFVKALQTAQAPQAGMVFYNSNPEELPEAGTYIAYIKQLKYADPTELVQAITPFASPIPQSIVAIKSSQTLVLRDYSENVKRELEVIDRIDVATPSEYTPTVIPIKYALASDMAQVLSKLTAGGGEAITVGQSRVGSFGGGAGGVGTGGLGNRFGNSGFGGGSSNPYQQGGFGGVRQYATTVPAATGASRTAFQNRLRDIVKRAANPEEITVLGQTKIIADERTNSLLIFASKEDLQSIHDIIDKLDVVLAQVLIEAIIMEVSLGDDLRYGVSYLQRPQQTGQFTGAGGIQNDPAFVNPNQLGNSSSNALTALASGFSYFGKYNNDFDFALQASASDSRVNVLSRPRIQTSHAVPARLFIGETRPYITGTYFGFSNEARSQYSQLRIGISLDVLPLINPDGLVVMDIQQSIESVGQTVKIDNNDVPTTIERQAQAKVAVRDRETIMLGGFITNNKTKNKSGVPILKDIPFLGKLFSSTSDSNNRGELIVLIRPTVLPTPQDAAIAAMEEKRKMPGVLQAEGEFQKAEQKRLDKVNKDLYEREGFQHQ